MAQNLVASTKRYATGFTRLLAATATFTLTLRAALSPTDPRKSEQ